MIHEETENAIYPMAQAIYFQSAVVVRTACDDYRCLWRRRPDGHLRTGCSRGHHGPSSGANHGPSGSGANYCSGGGAHDRSGGSATNTNDPCACREAGL